MDRGHSDEQRMICQLAREVAEREIAPHAAEADEQESFPWHSIRKLSEQGLMGLNMPERFGGGGAPYLTYVMVVEEIARACASTAIIYTTQTHCAHPIIAEGSPGLQERYLPELASGAKLGAIAITEPGAGSDVAAMQSTALREGDAYRVNGNKIFITTGEKSDTVVVFASVDRDRRREGISVFVVEKGWPGFRVGKVEKKMGLRGSDTAELILEDCRVPAKNMIGGEGRGFALVTDMLNKSRPNIAAIAVGVADAACGTAMRFAQERVQFGQPIAAMQAIQALIADMVTQISAARLLTHQAARSLDTNAPEVPLHSSMAKLFASDMAMQVTTNAVQVLGGYGYMRDYAVERYMRDAKVTQIFEGTNQVQRGIIANRVMRQWRQKG